MPQFHYPLDVCPEVAVVGVAFAPAPKVRMVSVGAWLDPSTFRAQTVAVPAYLLPRLLPHEWAPSYPVVVFTGTNFGELTDRMRDEVWRRWGVPVFEQLLAPDLTVIAEECDAHDGLHLVNEPKELEAMCGCGSKAPRVFPRRESPLAAAACA
jgi:hypothetical protein